MMIFPTALSGTACPSPTRTASSRLAGLALLTAAALSLCACTPLAGRDARLGKSSYGCMQRVVAEKLPADLDGAQAHCMAAGLIARYCSPSEAWLASAGKELRDLLGPGDAEVRDLDSDRRGMQCARTAADELTLHRCCAVAAAALPKPPS